MSSIADRLKALVSSWWGRVFPPPQVAVVLAPDGGTQAPVSAPVLPPVCDDEMYETGPESSGVFSLKEGLLDNLEDAFFYARRMRKADREAYDLHLRLGAALLPRNAYSQAEGLNEWWRAGNRPAFGCVAFLDKNTKEWLGMKFAYFTKIRRHSLDILPPEGRGTIYNLRVYYDDGKTKTGGSLSCHVEVARDGRILLCRERWSETRRIRHRKPRRPGERFSYVQTARFGVPPFLAALAEDHGITPEVAVQHIMAVTADGHWRASSGMIQVRVRKGHLAACFSIAQDRISRFFADRDLCDGRKKKIFHAVRAHSRSGTESRKGSNVRMHFRGNRAFDWNGYRVIISVPGLHHGSLIEIEEGATILADEEPTPRGWIGPRRFGKVVGDILDREAPKSPYYRGAA